MTSISQGQSKLYTAMKFKTPLNSISRTVAITVVWMVLLLAAIPWELRAQDDSEDSQPGGELSKDLADCLLKAGTDEMKQEECLKEAGKDLSDKAANIVLPDELGPVKPCVTGLAGAGVELGGKSVAEEYKGKTGEAVGFLWDTFGDCLKGLIPGLDQVAEVINALIPKAPNSLIWIPITDPLEGFEDLVKILLDHPLERTAQILDVDRNPIAPKTGLPFAHQWGAELPPACFVPEFVLVRPEGLLKPTHGDLRTSISPTNGHINIILPRFTKFWNIGPAIVGCFWLYNFMFTAYEVQYEVLTGEEYHQEGVILESSTCRSNDSCQFVKKGETLDLPIGPVTKTRQSGTYRLEYIRLDGVTQRVGDVPTTLTLQMGQPHELIYGWKRVVADLVIDEILVKPKPPTPALQQGQEFELFVKVRNGGEISALESDRRSPLSGETEIQVVVAGITGIGRATITGNLCDQPPRDCSLQPGEVREIQVHGPAGGWIAPIAPSVFLLAVIDPVDAIDEGLRGELNNHASLIVPLATPTLPDPTFNDPKAVGFAQIGPTVLRLRADVTNLSSIPASNVKVRFITEAPDPIGFLVIGEDTIPLLPGHAIRRATVDWDVCKVPAGQYDIGIQIDPPEAGFPDGRIQELNERNNNTGLVVDVPPSANKANFTTDQSTYQAGATVTLRFTNGCAQTISLRDSAPWVIKDSQGQTIFTPVSLPAITPVFPGETKSWQWDQKDQNGTPVKAGRYSVELETMDAGTYAVGFQITAKVRLDINAIGQNIRLGPVVVPVVVLNIPVKVNGNESKTPISLQFATNTPVELAANAQVTVFIGLVAKTLVFQKWVCDGAEFDERIIKFTLMNDTTCTVVYVEAA